MLLHVDIYLPSRDTITGRTYQVMHSEMLQDVHKSGVGGIGLAAELEAL